MDVLSRLHLLQRHRMGVQDLRDDVFRLAPIRLQRDQDRYLVPDVPKAFGVVGHHVAKEPAVGNMDDPAR